jgi:3-oxoacyl-[acyl-carrier protein] reductase
MKIWEDFTGAVAIVTGGAMGIGRQIVNDFSAAGASVVVCDIEKNQGQVVIEKIKAKGGKGLFLAADVTDEKMVEHVIIQTNDTFGRVDILVNNAGITHGTPLEKIEADEWDQVMAINLKGPFLFIKHVVDIMKSQHYGRIINMSSIAAIAGGGFVGTAHYAASKAGLVALTKAAAKNYGSFGITVNAVAPGPIRTRLSDSWVPTHEKEVSESIPVRRIGEPEDISNVVCFLAAKRSGFVNGHTFIVDGGVTIAASKNIV